MSKMMAPTIHMNGTSKDSLLEQVTEVYRSLQDAATKMALATPNARDYYPQGDGAHRAAMDEHDARVARAFSLIEEYEKLILAIEDQD